MSRGWLQRRKNAKNVFWGWGGCRARAVAERLEIVFFPAFEERAQREILATFDACFAKNRLALLHQIGHLLCYSINIICVPEFLTLRCH